MCYFTMDTRPWNGDMRNKGKWADWRTRFATIILSHNQAQKFHKTTYVTDEFGKYVLTKILKLKPDHIYTDIENIKWSPWVRHPDEAWAWGKFITYKRMAEDGIKHSVHLDDDFILWQPVSRHIQRESVFQSPEPMIGERRSAYLKYLFLLRHIADSNSIVAKQLKSDLPKEWIDYCMLPINKQVAHCVSIMYLRDKKCLKEYAEKTINLCRNFGQSISDYIYESSLVAQSLGVAENYHSLCSTEGVQVSFSNVQMNCFFEQWGLSAFMHSHNVKPHYIFNSEIEIRHKKGTGVHHVWGGASKLEYCKRINMKAKEMYPQHFPIEPTTINEYNAI